MSEYQYYEFAAIDRPLTGAEMALLRDVSTRADITPTGFVNHYEWGDLKADPSDWMRRYFDAFVYTANWHSCRFALRVPLSTFSKTELQSFEIENVLDIEATDTHWVINWSLCDSESEDYDRFGAEDGCGWMRRLAPLREEVLHGDLRPLYLGWLAAAASGELDDATLEPAVPPDLSVLFPAQQALAEFLEIDPDMLTAATAGSASSPPDATAQTRLVDAWLKEWTHDKMTAAIKLMVQGKALEAERQVRSRHTAWLKARRALSMVSAAQRNVGRLRELAATASGLRFEQQATAHAKQQAERRRQREAHLRLLMTDAAARWASIDTHATRATASGYEQAVRDLKELAEGYELTASRQEFDHALRQLLLHHTTRGALLRRLTEAGLWPV